jgi:hypothetical protein
MNGDRFRGGVTDRTFFRYRADDPGNGAGCRFMSLL